MSHKAQKRHKPDDMPKPPTLNVRTCSTCHRDISNEIYVKCARCSGFNQCLECFSIGAEAQSHLKTHPFVILEPILQPIFQKGWTAEEEILLLNAIQSCGLGNWHEISDVIKTKTPVECETHYFDTFVESPIAPLPQNKIIKESVLPPPPDFDTSPRESRPSISHEKNLAERNKKERTTPAEFAGWMPRRHEFEVEYMNDAEQLVSSISFSETEETEESLAKKLKSLRVYNEQLEERHLRTQFAEDYDLLDHDFRSFGGKTKQEREIEEQLLPLAQVLPKNELVSFIESYEEEMRLREQLETLKNWRMNGVSTHGEGALFNQLDALVREDRLSVSAVDKWNREFLSYTESSFRTTLDRQLLNPEENQICRILSISPQSYLMIKDCLLQEFETSGKMTSKMAVSLMPKRETVMKTIYEYLKKVGLFNKKDEEVEETEGLD
ncbi:Myb-like DNA-binding domain containing protein [Histomonas meleagridis]|uniref:Myb-like DNA-binding domain containing protein n=1 Tax=Histomonas meleagridis TaxID=135588 RepID=UPI00355A16FD|nr:Myb-like DNA-binding domain containing protein [Histomonas meleagridis]